MKKVTIYLSMNPTDGGKYQYSISLLEDLSTLNCPDLEVNAIYSSDHWLYYLEKFQIKGVKLQKENRFVSKLRSLIYVKLSALQIWRVFAKWFSRRYRQIQNLHPSLVFYPGNDSNAFEYNFASVIPVFDLMHRYEKFPEVSEPEIYNSREKHYKNACKYAYKILVDSELGKRQVMECYNVSENKIFIYPYKAPFYVHNNIQTDIIKKFGLPDGFYFYPAQFWEHKNHRLIIEAVRNLKEEGIHVYFVFVGASKNGFAKVVDLIGQYNLQSYFFILGYVNNDELVALYKKAKALVFPSFFGPTNIPPLEAIALNCPAFVSDIYAHREQLGNNAKYFNPNNSKDLIELIRESEFNSGSQNADNDKVNSKTKIQQNSSILLRNLISSDNHNA